MKKLYVLLTALFAFSAVVNAGVKNLKTTSDRPSRDVRSWRCTFNMD